MPRAGEASEMIGAAVVSLLNFIILLPAEQVNIFILPGCGQELDSDSCTLPVLPQIYAGETVQDVCERLTVNPLDVQKSGITQSVFCSTFRSSRTS